MTKNQDTEITEKDILQREAKDLMSMLQKDQDDGVQAFLGSMKMIVGAEALEDTVKWMVGESSQPPTAVRLMSSNITEKIELLNILLMMQNLQRSSALVHFMSEAEQMMFDKKTLVALDTPELLKVYDSAQKSLSNILDHTRKFVQKNKSITAQNEEMASVIDMLLSLSPEKYEKLKTSLKDPKLHTE